MAETGLFREGSGEPEPLSVSALAAQVRDVLGKHVGTVLVQGELSNFRAQPSGHLYFTLKDESAQMRAVMFRGDARGLGFTPRDGDQVVVRGEVTLYVPRGDTQIRVLTMRPRGRGSLQERFEALKRKLQAEGLFDAERKRPLPVFPQHVTVITSPAGAALRDFLNVLGRRCPRIAVRVLGVRVQGEGAHREVIGALAEAERLGGTDAVVICRGGGSLEDLWEFNEEALARAVAACPVPVISGVGHETDFTICDFAADLRAPTPSAAAELLSEADEVWRERLDGLAVQAGRALQERMVGVRRGLEVYRAHYVFREPVRIVEQWFQRLDDMGERMGEGMRNRLGRAKDRLASARGLWQASDPRRTVGQHRERMQALERQLGLLSPQATLDRGYSMALDPDGRLVRTAQEAARLQRFTVRFADAPVRVQTERPEP